MILSEAYVLIGTLKAIYIREQFTEESPAAYLSLLDDLAAVDVMTAVKIHGRRSKWCPTPAELRDIIAEQRTPVISSGDAWEQVLRQVRSKGRDRFDEVTFDHPAIMPAVKEIGWRRICNDERPDLVQRDFVKAFEAECAGLRRDVQTGDVPAISAASIPALRAVS